MQVEPPQDVDQVGPFAVLVDGMERAACRSHRQCRDVGGLTVGGRDGKAGRDTETNGLQSTQFL